MTTYGEMGFTEFEMELINKIGEWNFKEMVRKIRNYEEGLER